MQRLQEGAAQSATAAVRTEELLSAKLGSLQREHSATEARLQEAVRGRVEAEKQARALQVGASLKQGVGGFRTASASSSSSSSSFRGVDKRKGPRCVRLIHM